MTFMYYGRYFIKVLEGPLSYTKYKLAAHGMQGYFFLYPHLNTRSQLLVSEVEASNIRQMCSPGNMWSEVAIVT